MASISVSEQDFFDTADAANAASRAGDSVTAGRLDKLARKMNAALSNSRVRNRIGAHRSFEGAPLKWYHVPSTLRP